LSRLLIYAGPNGSGKSSLRDALGETTDVVIDPDQIARTLNPRNPRAADRQAGSAALTLFRQSVQAGRSLSIETTLAGQTVLNRLRDARAAGLEIGLYYVALSDVETNVGRVVLRAAAGGHYIEPDVVRRRAKSSLRNLPAAIALADRTVIFDNSGERHRRILEIDRRAVRILQEPPDWLAAVLPAIKVSLATQN
jgi:predicted ABC-type ATPase